jgi:hypothetical protein
MITYEIIGDDMQAVVVSLGSGDEIRAEAGAMTYMTDGIEMDARMQGGLGEGFILERLEGTGDVFGMSRRVRPDGRLRHRAGRRDQDGDLRRGRAVLRVDDRSRPRLGADAAVLAAGRAHPRRVQGRPGRSEAGPTRTI